MEIVIALASVLLCFLALTVGFGFLHLAGSILSEEGFSLMAIAVILIGIISVLLAIMMLGSFLYIVRNYNNSQFTPAPFYRIISIMITG